ncbi:MAG: hypothetical protein KDB79_04120 [Acidobacteria bacterium]|nr:hypothetical protein [Acidobacteriota bacterium]
MGNISIKECAVIANDVYFNYNKIASTWTRFHQKTGGDDGFFGAAYSRGSDVVVGIRGTQEGQDILDDMGMAPNLNGEIAGAAMKKMILDYVAGYPDSKTGAETFGFIAKWIFSKKAVRHATSNWGNQVPENQALLGRSFLMQVNNYCLSNRKRLRCIVGHSLGGAISQYLSEQTGYGGLTGIKSRIPAVAFNSPNMGTLSGMHKGSGAILIINARLDPLSYLTREVGNVSHAMDKAHEISNVDVGKPKDPPPPVIPNVSIEESNLKAFKNWLPGALLHYHSMDSMQAALSTGDLGKSLLSTHFPFL